MQKTIGNNYSNSVTYRIIYSHKKNILIIAKEILISFLLIILIQVFLIISMGFDFFYVSYNFFIYLYLVNLILNLVLLLPNYIRDHKNCVNYQINVDKNCVTVNDNKEINKIKFSLNDVENYIVIFFGFTIYQCIQLNLKNSKRIVIYNSMINYYKFKSNLKKSRLKEKVYTFRSIGHFINNIY